MKIVRIRWAVLAGLLAVNAAAQMVDTAVEGVFREPHSVAVDQANNIFVTDSANNRVVKYSQDTGTITVLAGSQGLEGFRDGKGYQAQFFNPRGIVFARDGLVVADYGNHRLRLIHANGDVETLAGDGEPGRNDGPAAQARFNYPIGLATDSAGNIYVADSKNNAIRRLGVDNVVSTLVTGLFEPAAVAVGENGDLWVADTRNHTIKGYAADGTPYPNRVLGSNSRYVSGGADDPFGDSLALFNNPRGLLWITASQPYLLVSDTGNHTLRKVFIAESGNYGVTTLAGRAGEAGSANGNLTDARLNSPIGVAQEGNGNLLVVDSANNSLRRVQPTAPQPAVSKPAIGIVVIIYDRVTGEVTTRLEEVTDSAFNNASNIQIVGEVGTEIFFVKTNVTGTQLELPVPTRQTGTLYSMAYRNGMRPGEVPPSMIQDSELSPDFVVTAIGMHDTRKPSAVSTARFRFKTGPPIVVGDNAAQFYVTNITQDAVMYFTTDGADPTPDNGTVLLVGDQVNLKLGAEDMTFKVRAYRGGFTPSPVITRVFSPTNFVANTISLGLEATDPVTKGEASSDFVAAAGQRFFAPVTLSLLPGQKIYSLQFNLTAKPTDAASPALLLSSSSKSLGFESLLMKPIPGKDIFTVIPPAMLSDTLTFVYTNSIAFINTNGLISFTNVLVTNFVATYQDLLFTNTSENLLGVGWVERAGQTNLYNTRGQDLVTYSLPHDTMFNSADGRIALGAFSFVVPASATTNNSYRLQVSRPSATSDGIGRPGSDVFILAPTNGSLGRGKINSIRKVTIGSRGYVVGDAAPFRWYNAGDFGDTNLMSDDVVQVFQSAVYVLNSPPEGSDFFDVMDSSNAGPDADYLYRGDDTAINAMKFGDGFLDLDDVFVTFRRSLDPSLTWYSRFWSNGVRVAVPVPNTYRGVKAARGAALFSNTETAPSPSTEAAKTPFVTFSAGDVVGEPGRIVQVPITAYVNGDLSLRMVLLNLTVTPQNGAPALEENVAFVPNAALGSPTLTTSQGKANYAAVWLNSSGAGLRGESVIGYLHVTIPGAATAESVYRIEFDRVSGSPNGLGMFPKQVVDGVLTMKGRHASMWGDEIPDAWRIKYFGNADSLFAHPNADADNDGVPNWAEYLAGTDPKDMKSLLRVAMAGRRASVDTLANDNIVLRWPSIAGKHYVLESSPSLTGGSWTVVANGIVGSGADLEFADQADPNAVKFYRVRIVE